MYIITNYVKNTNFFFFLNLVVLFCFVTNLTKITLQRKESVLYSKNWKIHSETLGACYITKYTVIISGGGGNIVNQIYEIV